MSMNIGGIVGGGVTCGGVGGVVGGGGALFADFGVLGETRLRVHGTITAGGAGCCGGAEHELLGAAGNWTFVGFPDIAGCGVFDAQVWTLAGGALGVSAALSFAQKRRCSAFQTF